jgi:uncharacterized membrane protein YedE/YeeE
MIQRVHVMNIKNRIKLQASETRGPSAHDIHARPPEGLPGQAAHELTSNDQVATDPWREASWRTLMEALGFGAVFGFLLQKGGVAKFDILIGQLLLESFVVLQVMLTAVFVGMVGVYLLNRIGKVSLQVKSTRLASVIVGGLLFGCGFGLLAYCPGTNVAALGQGNLDAWVGVLGLVAGSYAFALSSDYLHHRIDQWGQIGKMTLAEVFGLSYGATVAIVAPLLILILVVVELVSRY